jgi:hypothetical protein
LILDEIGSWLASYVPILSEPRSLLGLPRQRRTPVTEQTEIDLGSHIDGYNIQQPSSSTIGDALHFLMIRWPLCFGLLFKLGCMLQDLRPLDFAVLQEQFRVESDTAFDLDFSCLSMLEAYLS